MSTRRKKKRQPLRPRGAGWRRIGRIPTPQPRMSSLIAWEHAREGVRVLSDTGMYESEHQPGRSHQYHISTVALGSATPQRPTPQQFAFVLAAFLPAHPDGGQVWWEEDNHHSGVARHVFVPTDPTEHLPCPCKHEAVITEADGYSYSWDGTYDPWLHGGER